MQADKSGDAGSMIVTGGGRGIGAAVARLAAQHGYAVAINFARDERSAAAVVNEIESAGGRALAIQGDTAREADVIRLFKAAENLGPLTALVNNAGITGKLSRVENVSTEDLERVLAVNILGPFLCAREAIPRMSTKQGRRGGAIVNVSSRAAKLGGSGDWVHYAASKGAIDSFTVGLAKEVAAEGIRVNAVAPGLIETEIHAAAGAPDRTARLGPSVPLGRAGGAFEVAEAIMWLCSPAASYVTGVVLDVSGGR